LFNAYRISEAAIFTPGRVHARRNSASLLLQPGIDSAQSGSRSTPAFRINAPAGFIPMLGVGALINTFTTSRGRPGGDE
jgi:hypothetical protein